MSNKDRSHSPYPKLNSLLTKVLQTVQNPQYNEDPSNYDPIVTLLRSNKWFRTKLEAPANLHDFVQIAKLHMNYEVHPYGTVLMKENDLADKLYIILKGDIAKLQQRPHRILDQEIQAKRRDNPRWDTNDTRNLFKISTKSQIQSRTARTKRTITKLFSSAYSMASLPSENDPEISQLKERIHGTLTNLDSRTPKARRAGLRIISKHSLEDLDDEDDQEEKLDKSMELGPSLDLSRSQGRFESSEEEGGTFRRSFRRLDTLSHSDIQNITRNNTEPRSLGDWNDEEGTGSDEAGLQEPTDLDDEEKFFKYIGAKYPNIKSRIFINEIVRIEKNKTYKPGEFFGDNFSKPQQPRENAIMAVCSKQVHVLTLTRVSYRAIMAEIVHQSYDKGVFFTQLFPSFNKELIEKFSHYFSQDSFRKGEVIYKQDERPKKLFVLQKGDITLTKQMKKPLPKPQQNFNSTSTRNIKTIPESSVELLVASITKNQFFGEEVLMHKELRQYTATVKASETTAFFIEAKAFNRIQEGFPDLVKMLRDQAFERFAWREQRTVDLLDQQKQNQRVVTNGVGLFLPAPEKQKSNTSASNAMMSPGKMLPPLDLQSPNNNNKEFPELLDLERTRSDPNSLFKSRSQNVFKVASPSNDLSTLRNLETYKSKFSRKILEDTTRGLIKPFDQSFEPNDGSKTTTNAFRDFNIRKELQESTPTNYKLPKMPSTSQLGQISLRKEKSVLKSRDLRLKKKASEIDTSLGADPNNMTPKEACDQNKNLTKSMQFTHAVKQFFVQPITGTIDTRSPNSGGRGGYMKGFGNVSNDYGFQGKREERRAVPKEAMTQSYVNLNSTQGFANIINYNDMSLERHKPKLKIKDIGSLRAKLNRICKVKGQQLDGNAKNKIPPTSYGA